MTSIGFYRFTGPLGPNRFILPAGLHILIYPAKISFERDTRVIATFPWEAVDYFTLKCSSSLTLQVKTRKTPDFKHKQKFQFHFGRKRENLLGAFFDAITEMSGLVFLKQFNRCHELKWIVVHDTRKQVSARYVESRPLEPLPWLIDLNTIPDEPKHSPAGFGARAKAEHERELAAMTPTDRMEKVRATLDGGRRLPKRSPLSLLKYISPTKWLRKARGSRRSTLPGKKPPMSSLEALLAPEREIHSPCLKPEVIESKARVPAQSSTGAIPKQRSTGYPPMFTPAAAKKFVSVFEPTEEEFPNLHTPSTSTASCSPLFAHPRMQAVFEQELDPDSGSFRTPPRMCRAKSQMSVVEFCERLEVQLFEEGEEKPLLIGGCVELGLFDDEQENSGDSYGNNPFGDYDSDDDDESVDGPNPFEDTDESVDGPNPFEDTESVDGPNPFEDDVEEEQKAVGKNQDRIFKPRKYVDADLD